MASGPRTWFITGCSTGFGRVLATHVLNRGDRVALTARNLAMLSDLVDAFPNQARAYQLDVCNQDEITRVIEDVEYDFAPIDYLVNNAGYVAVGAIEELRPADYRKVFDTNFFGALELIRNVLPFMRQRRSGTIINMSALGGIVANAGLGYYCASKHALEAVSEALAEELAPLNIRVLIVEPGQFRTDAMSKRFEALHIPDYEDLLRPLRQRFAELDGKQPGDPERAALAIMAALHAHPPTLRLPLGRDAITRIRRKITSLSQEMDRWEPVALATDFQTE